MQGFAGPVLRSRSPRNGKPFTSTFLYGYQAGQLIFLEPMVALSFLQQRPNFADAVPQPESFSHPGYYPKQYRLSFDPGRQMYAITLAELRAWRVASLPGTASPYR